MINLRPYPKSKRQPTWLLAYNLREGRQHKHMHRLRANAMKGLDRSR